MLITDQVAIAPCTDRVQARRFAFEAKPLSLTGSYLTNGNEQPASAVKGRHNDRLFPNFYCAPAC